MNARDGYLIQDSSRFTTLAGSSDVICWELDLRTWRFTYVSPGAAEMLGYPVAEWTNEGFWSSHLHPEDREKALNMYAAATARRDDYVLEYRMLARDGRVVWIRDMVSAHSEVGDKQMLRGFMMDITDRRGTEEALLSTIDKLSRSNAELERFAYVASHDLQEPLRTIVGFSQLLERKLADHPDVEIQDYLALVANAGRRMHSLIADLLAYARSGCEVLPDSEVNLGEIVHSVAATMRDRLDACSARMRVAPLPTIVCDRDRVVQVFTNLLSNAVKFRDPGRPLEISIDYEAFGEVISLSVADNGIGVDPAHFEDIFHAFKRLHHHSEIPGSGIGLAVVRRNVEMHGGKVWVESQPGQGAVFRFTLPQAPIPLLG